MVKSGFCLGLLICLPLAAGSDANEWLQWRGPQRDAKFHGPTWPTSLSNDHLKQMWRHPMAPGYSGPIVAAGKVFVTETVDKKLERVVALDLATGRKKWSQEWRGAISVPFFASANGSWIRATPAYADGRLYVAGIEDQLICLDGETGKVLWHHDFPEQYKVKDPSFGFVCSPLVDQGFVYVHAGGGFLKLRAEDGSVVWRSLEDKGGMMGGAFSSPIIANIEGKRRLLVQTRTHLAGLSIEDGSVLWQEEIPTFRGMNILTPTVAGNRVFTSTYRGKAHLFELSSQSSKELWQSKATGYMSSPVIIEDHVYLHLQNRRLSCVSLSSGVEKWRTSERFGKYWSMVANDKQVLALDEEGELILFEANPQQFKLLDRRKISEQDTWAHLAVTPGRIYIRELNAIAAYSWE